MNESDYPTRDKLVRNLTPHEAGQLLVHCHVITQERRSALLFLRGPANAYFSPERQAEIKKWIAEEDYLPQDSKLADHPKRPTHWCNYCGHVESCEHDKPKYEHKPKHKLKPWPEPKRGVGEMQLDYLIAGSVLQSIAQVVAERGVDRGKIRRFLLAESDGLDQEFWDLFGGPAADWLQDKIARSRI